jgi:rhamnogalacturonyl hydrolase YesR
MKNKKALIKKLVDKVVHVKKSWWDPMNGIEWKVVKEEWNLTDDEYRFLTVNRYLYPITSDPSNKDEIDLVLTEKALNLIKDESKNKRILQSIPYQT